MSSILFYLSVFYNNLMSQAQNYLGNQIRGKQRAICAWQSQMRQNLSIEELFMTAPADKQVHDLKEHHPL